MAPSSSSRLPRSVVQLLTAAAVAASSLPSWAAPGLGFDDRGSPSGLSGSVQLFRLDAQGFKPLPDLITMMSALPTSTSTSTATSIPSTTTADPDSELRLEAEASDLEWDAVSTAASDVPISRLGPMGDGSLIALNDWSVGPYTIAQRPIPPRPVRPPTPIKPTPAPAPAPAPSPPLISSAVWTVVIVAGVAVAVLVATNGPTPPVSR
jgi:hypothetical protein